MEPAVLEIEESVLAVATATGLVTCWVLAPAAGSEIDSWNAPQLRLAISQALKHPCTPCELLVLDLSGVRFCDSAGIGCVVFAWKRFQGKVRVVLPPPGAPCPRWVQVFGWTQIDRLVNCYNSEQEAISGEGSVRCSPRRAA